MAGFLLGSLLALVSVIWAAPGEQPRSTGKTTAPVTEVMVVATYHMSNPGRDIINLQAGDVLTPGRQREIQRIVTSLSRFRPTKVAVEWEPAYASAQWTEYRADKLANSRNEVVQLGFRLAAKVGATPLGIDAPGEFPFGPLAQFAQANGFGAIIEQGLNEAKATTGRQERILADQGIPALLRVLNQPSAIARSHSIYMSTLRIGKGDQQPGVELVSSWYRRNARICANLLQVAQPGDRVVVLFGENHAHFLRRCAIETPGVRLVEPLPYLPQ